MRSIKSPEKWSKVVKNGRLWKKVVNNKGGIYMITKDTLIGDIVKMKPELVDLLMELGMHCVGCPASAAETLEEACAVHGIDVEEALEALNTVNDSEPSSYETTILDDSALWDLSNKKDE